MSKGLDHVCVRVWCVCVCLKEWRRVHAAKDASSSAGKDNRGEEIESKGARERERGRESIVRERRDYSKLVANAQTCIILQCQAHKAATCPTKTKIHGADDCELGLDPDPGHHD